MTLNIAAYGMGLGLVMVGWMAGIVVSYAFAMARSTRYMG